MHPNKILLSALLFLASCNVPSHRPAAPSECDNLDDYDKKITSKFVKQEKENRKLGCIGTGLRVPEDKILYFSFIFLVKGNPSIGDARALLITIIRDCAELIASNPNSSKFLIKPPESIENARIAVLFERTDGQEKDAVVYASNFYNKLYYSKNGGELGFQDFYEETFEEAERILTNQNKINSES